MRREALTRRFRARWAVAVVAMGMFGLPAWNAGVSPIWLVFAVVATVFIAAAAPLRSSAERKRELTEARKADPLSLLSAQALLDAVPEPVLIVNNLGAVLCANREYRTVFGIPSGDPYVLLRFRTPEVQAMLKAAFAGVQMEPVVFEERTPVDKWFRIACLPLTAPENAEHALHLVHFRDLSESRRIDQMREDFIANASHELRTPLASLIGYLETLAGPARNDAPARDRFLTIMQEQAARMSRLVNDLLSLSRLETQMDRSRFGPVDIADVVASTVRSFKPAAAKASVEMIVDLQIEGATVRGNRDELTEIVENLVDNALKYGRSGKRIEISVRPAEIAGAPAVEFAVRDHGEGIAREHIPRLTERFYRVNVEASRERRGTGLGLAIVKRIVARHSGTLAIDSRLGVGSVFTITLPATIGTPLVSEKSDRKQLHELS